MSIRIIIIIFALATAALAGGTAFHYGPDFFDGESGTAEHREADVETVAMQPSEIKEDPAAVEHQTTDHLSDEPQTTDDLSDEPLLVAPNFDLIRVEPTGELLAAGRAAPGAAVDLLLDASLLASDTTNNDGEWAMIPEAPLPVGEHELVLRASGADGQGGPIEGDRAIIVIAEEGQPMIALARPGEPVEIIQEPDEAAVAEAEQPRSEPELALREDEAEEPATDVAAVEPSPVPAEVSPQISAAPDEADEAVAIAQEGASSAASEGPAVAAGGVAVEDAEAVAVEDAEAVATSETATRSEPELARQDDEPEAASVPAVVAEPLPAPVPEAVIISEMADDTGTGRDSPRADGPDLDVAMRQEDQNQPAAAPAAVMEPLPAPAQEAPEVAAAPEAVEGADTPHGVQTDASTEQDVAENKADVEVQHDLSNGPETSHEPAAPMVVIDTVQIAEPDLVHFSGRADPGETVRLSINDQPMDETRAGEAGGWSSSGEISLPPGRYVARADVIGENGEVRASARLRFDRVRVALTEPEQPASSAATTIEEPDATPERVASSTVEATESAAAEADAEPSVSEKEEAVVTVATPAPPAVEPETAASASAERPSTLESAPSTADQAPSIPVRDAEAAAIDQPALAELAETAIDILPESPEAIYIERGDNLWRIARSIYGRGIEFRLIYEANRDLIRNPHLIYPGQVLTIPLPEEPTG